MAYRIFRYKEQPTYWPATSTVYVDRNNGTVDEFVVDEFNIPKQVNIPPASGPAQVNSDWNATTGVAAILNKPTTLAGYGITDGVTTSSLSSTLTGYVPYTGATADLLLGSNSFGIGTSPSRSLHVVGTGALISGTHTAAANNECIMKFFGTGTLRATLSDSYFGVHIAHTLVAAANNQILEAVRIEPTFTLGAFTNTQKRALRVIGNVMINTATLNSFNNYPLVVRTESGEGIYVESATICQVLLQAGGLTGGDGKVTIRAGNNNNGYIQMGNVILRQGGNGFAIGTSHFNPTAVLDLAASTTTVASLRLRTGVAPSTPNDGDIWQDGTNIKIRIGGATKTFTLV